MMSRPRRPRRPAGFLVAAFAVGTSFGTASFGVALLVLAEHGSSALVGALTALITVGTTAGALMGGRAAHRLGADDALAVALVVDLAGMVLLFVPGGLPVTVLGCLLVGAALGQFWVASQARLGTSGGRAYVRHYSAYVAGTALGGPGAGWVIGALAGNAHESGAQVRAAFLLGVAVLTAAVWCWPPRVSPLAFVPRPLAAPSVRGLASRSRAVLGRGVHLQAADLFLVAGFNVPLTVSAVVLRRDDGVPAAWVGLVFGGVAAAKVLGSVGGQRLVARLGERRVYVWGLGLAALALGAAPWFGSPGVYVALVLASVVMGLGQWAPLVGVAVAQMPEPERPALLSSWNMREYAVISTAAALSGALLDPLGATGVLGIAGLLVLAAAVAAGRLLDAAPSLAAPAPATPAPAT